MKSGERALGWLQRAASLFAIVGAVNVVVLVGVTVVAVLWRYAFNQPIFGIEDVATMALSLVVAGSIAYGAGRGSHIFVDVISMAYGRKVTRFTDIPVRTVGIVVTSVAAYALYQKGVCGFDCGYFSPNLAIPHKPFYFFLAGAMALYALTLFLELVVGLATFGAAVDPNEHS